MQAEDLIFEASAPHIYFYQVSIGSPFLLSIFTRLIPICSEEVVTTFET